MTEKTVKKVLVFIVAAAVLFAGSSAGLSVAGAVNLPDTEMEDMPLE